MSIIAPIVKDNLYEEVFCLKSMSILHVDLGNVEVKEGDAFDRRLEIRARVLALI